MEKIGMMSNSNGSNNKKIFIRKEIEASRLGNAVYEDDILSQYTVYLVRKFDQEIEYNDQEQFDLLLNLLPEEFNTTFEHFALKKLYVRTTSKAVYLSLLIALAQPLVKTQINELRSWVNDLVVPELPLRHTSNFMEQGNPIDMMRGLQETNSEVLLLTEMMNQFGQNLTELFDEVKQIKEKKAPPVVKVVSSDAVTKHSIENENRQNIADTIKKMEQLTTEFDRFKKETQQKINQPPKRKKPPKFKIVLGTGIEGKVPLESRLEQAMSKIDFLTKEIHDANKKIVLLDEKVVEKKKQKRPKISFSTARKVATEKNQLASTVATTSEEVLSLSKQLQQINDKLTTLEKKPNPDAQMVEKIEKDRGKIQENASETIKLAEMINQLTEKLQTVEAQLGTVKEEQVPPAVVDNTDKKSIAELTEQHQKDQELLKMNAAEIGKLTQTVGKVDVQLIQAHQKIAELEQKMKNSAKLVQHTREAVAQQPTPTAIPQGPRDVPRAATATVATPTPIPERQTRSSERDFPTKEAFLQSIKQTGTASRSTSATMKDTPGVTLAIEEVLDRVTDKHPNTSGQMGTYSRSSNSMSNYQGSNLRQLKKMEWDIHSIFQKNSGVGFRGMVSKETFRSNLKKMDVLPYLWGSVYKREQKDILLGNELSCQKLINELDDFLEEAKHFAQKRKVMGKWIYCPKEVEQKMEGYKLLNDYFELYLGR